MSAEDGGSLIGTVIMFVIIGAIVSVMANSAIQSMRDAGEQAAHVAGMPAADAAIAKFRVALDEGYASLADNYTLDAQDLDQIAGEASVLGMDSPQVPDEFKKVDSVTNGIAPAGAVPSVLVPFTMVETIDGESEIGYWQLVRVIPPDFSMSKRASLIVYVRAWMGDATGGTQGVRTIRVEYRANSFGRYQVVSDAPIALQDGARLGGPVHSNGYGVAAGGSAVQAPGGGKVTCDGRQRISTATGSIAGLGKPCALHESTGKKVNFSNVGFALDRFDQVADDTAGITGGSCGGNVECVGSGAPLPGGGYYDVRLDSTTVRWRRCSAGGGCGSPGSETIESASDRSNPGEALLFYGDVHVYGQIGGRVTIAARQPAESALGASIHIVGDTLSRRSGSDVLGLVAQSDIVIEVADNGACPVRRVHAALAAGTGALTMPRGYLSQVSPGSTVACAAPLEIVGSIASRESPTLVWGWGSQKVGYTSRRYVFDSRLKYDIPPHYPLARGWRPVGWTEANLDCLGTRWSDPTCT